MNFFQRLPAPLLRVKALMWAHSLIGAVIMVGLFAVLACGLDPWFIPAIGACALAWILALRPLGRQASDLSPEDFVRPTGLPGRLLAVCAGVQLVGMLFGRTPQDGLLALAYTIVLVTLMTWNLLSTHLRIPFHQKTWTICLLLAGVGLGRHLVAWSLLGNTRF